MCSVGQDLKKFMDEAVTGVVYFSMGSNIKSSEVFKGEKLRAFLEAFEKLKLKVLWKWEGSPMPNQPDHVKTYEWLPQQDLLGM